MLTALASRFQGGGRAANLTLHGFDQNRIWCQIVALASELQAWTGMLALAGQEARRWEPNRLRYRLYSIPASLARARRVVLHLVHQSPWAGLILDGITRLQNLPAPAPRPPETLRPGNPPTASDTRRLVTLTCKNHLSIGATVVDKPLNGLT